MTELIIQFYDVQGNVIHTLKIQSSIGYDYGDIQHIAEYELNLCGFTSGVVDSWSFKVKEPISCL